MVINRVHTAKHVILPFCCFCFTCYFLKDMYEDMRVLPGVESVQLGAAYEIQCIAAY